MSVAVRVGDGEWIRGGGSGWPAGPDGLAQLGHGPGGAFSFLFFC